MSTPTSFVGFSQDRGLAPDGRCKSFSADADGTGWGEGAGLLLVERLSQARRHGHPVLAVVRGSAVNSDGASNGLAAPNGPSQQRVIRQALASAQLPAEQVDAVEAHGTGTTLGDPIEAQALLATYGQRREPDRPLWLGSLKSNIGHAQAAAGVGGIIKMVEALRHDLLPQTLHVTEPTPEVDWSAGQVRLLTGARPWPAGDRPRRAGVSAFGLSGTNSHVIIEEAPATEQDGDAASIAPAALAVPLMVSGHTAAALRAQARRLSEHLGDGGGARVLDLGFSLATSRAALEHRAAVVAADHIDAVRGLTALAGGGAAPGLVRGIARADGRTAFLFPGQGTQHLGMGRELHQAFPVFADAFDAVLAELDPHLDRPLRDVVWGQDAELLAQTGYAQTGIFAVEVALYRLLESWRVRADYLAGHSIGELAAAHVAGVLTLPDAATLVAARGRLMQALPSGGAMVAVQATENEVLELLGVAVSIAAVNGPSSVVISGGQQAVLAAAEHLRGLGRKTTRLAVSRAFHSPLMEPMLAEFGEVAAGLGYAAPKLAAVSMMTGRAATAAELTSPQYWVRQVRETVRFGDSVRWMAGQGVRTFLELGSDAALSATGPDCIEPDADHERPAVFAALLRRGHAEVRELVTALGRANTAGVAVDWPAFYADRAPRRVELPTYDFQRRWYWHDGGGAPAPSTGQDPVDSWRYRVAWQPVAEPAAGAPAGTWLVAVPGGYADDRRVSAVIDGLAGRGARVVRFEVAGANRAALAGRLREHASAAAPAGVLSLLAWDDREHPTHPGLSRGYAATVALVQALGDAELTARLWCATSGAVGVEPAELPSPRQAAVWGLGIGLALDIPDRWGGLVDLPGSVDADVIRLLCSALSTVDGEDQLAVRTGGAFARRMVRAAPGKPATPGSWRPRGTVLITGGTGGLGAHVARLLAGHGAEHLVLVSRRGRAAAGVAALEAELSACGARVSVEACDVGDRGALARLLDSLPGDLPLTTVVHAAGVRQRLAPLSELTLAEVAEVAEAKVCGAVHLDDLLAGTPLDAFVLFSSGAAVWGSAGQAAYAGANAALDALAHRRRAGGRTATAIAWGSWDSGMVDSELSAGMRRIGAPPMPPELALSALRQALEQGEDHLVVADIDWARFAPVYTMARPRPLLDALPEVRDLLDAGSAPSSEPELLGRLAGMPAAQQGRVLLDLVRTEVAGLLGYDEPVTLEPGKAFTDLGFDSVAATDLRSRLSAATGRKLPATLVFDHATPAALAEYLRTELAPDAGPAARVLADLHRLEQTVASLAPEEIERNQLTARLQTLLTSITRVGGGPAGLSDRLAAATADDVFDFIDKELGVG